MKKCLVLLAAVFMTMLLVVGCSKGITADEAKDIAVELMDGIEVEDIASCELNEQGNYEMKILIGDLEFTICLAKEDGTLLQFESETVTAGNQPADGVAPKDMGKAAIKKIALEQVSGAKETDVFYCMYCINDDDKAVYDVMVNNGEKVIEFEIDASTGEILSREEMDPMDVDINH